MRYLYLSLYVACHRLRFLFLFPDGGVSRRHRTKINVGIMPRTFILDPRGASMDIKVLKVKHGGSCVNSSMLTKPNVNRIILGQRLRELAPTARGGQEAGSRNPRPQYYGIYGSPCLTPSIELYTVSVNHADSKGRKNVATAVVLFRISAPVSASLVSSL